MRHRQNALVSGILSRHIGVVPRTMDRTAATPPPVRLLVSSATEAEKIREYATTWTAFERSAARFRRTKRWQVAQRRTADLTDATFDRAHACLEAWLVWQTARAMRGCDDVVVASKLGGDEGCHPRWIFNRAFSVLSERREVERRHWIRSLRHALTEAQTVADAEANILETARPAAKFCEQVLRSYLGKSVRAHHRDLDERMACTVLATFGKFDCGQLTGLVFGTTTDEFNAEVNDRARFPQAISDGGLDRLHQKFLHAWAVMDRLYLLFDAQLRRRDVLLKALQPDIGDPAREWHEARFYQWLFRVSFTRLDDELWGERKDPAVAEVPVTELLNAPLCWQLWLHDRWENLGAAAATMDAPMRDVLTQLVESPARFLRFPNPTPAIADLRRILRPVSDLLEGYHAPAERTALSAALRNPTTSRDESVHLLSVHCARRWSGDIPPKVRERFLSCLEAFLREEIVPQAPDILRSCRVEVGAALQSQFDADFGKLLAEEESAEAGIEAELSAQRDAWRDYVPASGPAAPLDADLESDLPSRGRPIALRYILNLGEPVPKEVRLATTGATLAEDLEQFCERHGIAINIPFSSVAHAIEQYCFHTPMEKKRLWPERETYGPIELHKIKRGAMRILVRESSEGLWVNLLQRKDWFLGARR